MQYRPEPNRTILKGMRTTQAALVGVIHVHILKIISVHAEFSLETFRHKLDEQGMSIAENQEQSVKSRKKLAETTRGTQACASLLAVCPSSVQSAADENHSS